MNDQNEVNDESRAEGLSLSNAGFGVSADPEKGGSL